ncbi:MAG: hypothetical protein KBF47_17870, partial [Gemmatimonadales bacterium]|nr:hypothetical protein [Gemmatimonadales bacterium]
MNRWRRASGVTAALLALTLGDPILAQQPPAPRLVGTAELARLLAADVAVEPAEGQARRTPVLVIDVRQSWTSYLQNHLTGAVWLNVETLRAQRDELPFQLLSGAQYAELFRRLGATPTRRIVIYSAGEQLDIDATFT